MNKTANHLFEHLTAKQPGQIGMKGILKGDAAKSIKSSDFSMQGLTLPSLSQAGKGEDVTTLRMHITSLESQIAKQQKAIKKLEEKLEEDVRIASVNAMREGERKGQAVGVARASAEFKQELQKLQATVQEALQQVENSQHHHFEQLEQAMLTLVQTSIQRVFPILSKKEDKWISHIVKSAMSLLGNTDSIVLKVNPQDYTTTQQDEHFWLPISGELKSLKIVEDERITQGGCVLESESGSIDMRLETIITQLSNVIDEALEKENASL
jgi:flagellar assembly protein FliH